MKYINSEGIMATLKDAEVATLEERVRRLEDINSVKECMYHYLRCCDLMDPDMMASCFTETAKLSWGDVYPNVYYGRKEILENLRKVVGAAKTQTHYCTNQQVYFQTDDSAIVYCHMYSWQTFKDPEKEDIYCFGRYETQVVRDFDGEWRFQSFKFVLAGQIGAPRECEQFDRPWPPEPIPDRE